MKTVKGGVTAPKGFLANGLFCGIKRSGKRDLSLLFSEVPTVAVGVFTTNSIKAAPLEVTAKHLGNHRAQAVIINSGNANCFTGKFGRIYAEKSAELIASLLNIKKTDVLVASTGIIGKPLPYQKIADAAPGLVRGLNATGGHKAAEGIMTTDTFSKEIAVRVTIAGKPVTIGGCAKGSGMIEPNMATMLGFITTDAVISAPVLQKALAIATEKTFNCITVDGCMSTNDMVTVMANGLAGNRTISASGKDFQKFYDALEFVCRDLAQKIVIDGEGATKFIEINVTGAKNDTQAKQAAKAVANSNLVKTAAFGNNPNWGRVAAAVGSLGLNVTEKTLKIKFSPFDKKNIRIDIHLPLGKGRATVYTSDLTYEYVRINGAYN